MTDGMAGAWKHQSFIKLSTMRQKDSFSDTEDEDDYMFYQEI